MSKFDGGYVNIHTNTAMIQNMAMMRASISQIIVFLLRNQTSTTPFNTLPMLQKQLSEVNLSFKDSVVENIPIVIDINLAHLGIIQTWNFQRLQFRNSQTPGTNCPRSPWTSLSPLLRPLPLLPLANVGHSLYLDQPWLYGFKIRNTKYEI